MTPPLPPMRWTDRRPYEIAVDALLHLQWSVFPLGADKKPPLIHEGRTSHLQWRQWQAKRATEEIVRSWQAEYNPAAWAVITGAISNIVVLDFDGQAGQETRERLKLLHPHVQTGSGGHHVYFHHPGWPVSTLNGKSKQSLGRSWPGLDIRADGGYAAFCGWNTHGSYRWLRSPEPEDLACLPEELRRFLGLLEAPATAATIPVANQPAGNAPSAEDMIEQALHRIREGTGRNDSGFILACALRDSGYSRDAALDVMQMYVEKVPAKNAKGQSEPYTLEEARTSVYSAFTKEPRSPQLQATLASFNNENNRNNDRPNIIVNGGQLGEIVDCAVDALLTHDQQAPSMFIQSARLVRIGHSERGRPLLIQMGQTEVKEVLTHCANFFRVRKQANGGSTWTIVSPPNELAEQILARQAQAPHLPFPALATIIETPVISPDGSILDQPGYDAATQLYYAPQAGMEACKVSLAPTVAEREQALTLLLSTIGEFPYVDDADRANALGLLLTPLLRPAITRHVPLALIDAPKQGTGKGLLSDVVSLIATGTCAPILTMSDSDEEMQKVITALLIEGNSIITIDNISGRLQSRHLDAVLTADQWRGRILGSSKTVLVPQRATWLATGNNIKLGGDLARRCYRIRLDAKVSRPYLRKGFTHSDLATWVSEHRGELIGALLTLARAWYAAGTPQDEHLPALGTFSGWVKIIGGILAHAGVKGFLSNMEQLYDDADEESNQWEAFFATWLRIIGPQWVPLSVVVDAINASDDSNEAADYTNDPTNSSFDPTNSSFEHENNGARCFVDTLPASLQMALKEKPRSFAVCLAKALERLVDSCFGAENLRLEKMRATHSNRNHWRIFAGGASGDSALSREKIRNDINICIHENAHGNEGNYHSHLRQTQSMHNSLPAPTSAEQVTPPPLNEPPANEKPPLPPAQKRRRIRL